jgi:hypothetical protein
MDFNFKTKLEEKNVVNQMTVFNSQEVDTKKQPMFFGAPLGFSVMILISIQFSTN